MSHVVAKSRDHHMADIMTPRGAGRKAGGAAFSTWKTTGGLSLTADEAIRLFPTDKRRPHGRFESIGDLEWHPQRR